MVSLSIDNNKSWQFIYFLRKFLTSFFVFKETNTDEFLESNLVDAEFRDEISRILHIYSKNYKKLESDLDSLERQIDTKKRQLFPNKKKEWIEAPIYSHIVGKPIEEELRLRDESAHIQRIPINRPAADGDFDRFKEGVIEIEERAELPVVNKEARVVEEINVNKEVSERTETVRDAVKKQM